MTLPKTEWKNNPPSGVEEQVALAVCTFTPP
jgi:hypothetical protein